jgi:Bardet-Biedl syndrome 7 protein
MEDVDKNVSLTSRSPSSTEDGNAFLATCRMIEPMSRVQLRVKLTEGQAGELLAYIIPNHSPKSAQIVSFQLQPLSMHFRINEADAKPAASRPMNELKITGSFSMAEVHSWIVLCLPDVPAKYLLTTSFLFY